MSLKERYGPWALIVGGSEAIGDHYVSPENVEYFRALASLPRREAAELQRNLLTRMLRAPTGN
jgi:hypothetical protein